MNEVERGMRWKWRNENMENVDEVQKQEYRGRSPECVRRRHSATESGTV